MHDLLVAGEVDRLGGQQAILRGKVHRQENFFSGEHPLCAEKTVNKLGSDDDHSGEHRQGDESRHFAKLMKSPFEPCRLRL